MDVLEDGHIRRLTVIEKPVGEARHREIAQQDNAEKRENVKPERMMLHVFLYDALTGTIQALLLARYGGNPYATRLRKRLSWGSNSSLTLPTGPLWVIGDDEDGGSGHIRR
ncbi:hypothetical protein [Synechococcus sp. CS-1332]|uniref:hypothetical protein n=1 Tax=Synechococcus sp. CS-1332 TaxID=2847972 RepID=UPI00223B710F|nr:hypothetical protein [Synechococcus sp. CS-1332]